MNMQNDDRYKLSEQVDSSTSANAAVSKQSYDRDHEQTESSHEVNRILAACQDPHDLHLLIQLATSTGGLINDQVRKVACKSLVELKITFFPTLTATEGRYCLATDMKSPRPPALLPPGAIFHAIKMKIRSSLT